VIVLQHTGWELVNIEVRFGEKQFPDLFPRFKRQEVSAEKRKLTTD
jgi:hypothetical protein